MYIQDYLNFPSDNYIGKKLSKERYIKSSNATFAERKKLAKYLDSIEILYSFPYDDGEIVVLLAEYSLVKNHEFSLNNFVRAIAQSLPYNILLIVKCEGVIRFFSFVEERNRNNEYRSRVFSISSSADIIPLADSYVDNELIFWLRQAALGAVSAAELNERWHHTLLSNREYDDSMIVDTFPYSVSEYHMLIRKDKIYERITSNSFDDNVADGFLFKGIPLDMDDLEHKSFVEFCAYHSRLLYEEAFVRYDFPEDEWLKKYFESCNSFAKCIFDRVIGTETIRIISNVFWNGNEDYEHSRDYFDVSELKECIGYYYFDEEE